MAFGAVGLVLVAAEWSGWRDKVVWYEYDAGLLRCRTQADQAIAVVPADAIRRMTAVRSPRLGEQYVCIETADGRSLLFWHYLLPHVAELHRALMAASTPGAVDT